MTVTEMIRQLENLSSADRLLVIESATRLIRRDIATSGANRETDLRSRAEDVKDLYEPGGPLREWLVLDSEEVIDDGLKLVLQLDG